MKKSKKKKTGIMGAVDKLRGHFWRIKRKRGKGGKKQYGGFK
jgi:hypothetical protein